MLVAGHSMSRISLSSYSTLLNAGAFCRKRCGRKSIQAPGHRAAILPCLRCSPTIEGQCYRCIDSPTTSVASVIKHCLVVAWLHWPFTLGSGQARNFRYDRNVMLLPRKSRSDSTIEGRGCQPDFKRQSTQARTIPLRLPHPSCQGMDVTE